MPQRPDAPPIPRPARARRRRATAGASRRAERAASPSDTHDRGDRPRPARAAASGSSIPAIVPITKATDLGSVQVLKHGNLYLLTDPFGDIHPDSRGLGLYHLDTRLLSCCALRVGGSPAGPAPGLDGRQLPRLDPAHEPERRPQPGRQGPARADDVAGRTLGISRDRLIGNDGMEERVRIVNHAERALEFPSSSSSAATRPTSSRSAAIPGRSAGRSCRSPSPPTRGDLPLRRPRRDAPLDPRRLLRRGRTAFGPIDGRSEDAVGQGGSVRFRWDVRLAPGERRDLRWTIWSTTSGRRGPGVGRRASPGERAALVAIEAAAAARPDRRPVPGAAPGQRDDGVVRLPRLEPRDDRDPDRPRAVQPDARPLARRSSAADQRRPGPGPALRRGRRAVVRDAVRAGRAHRVAPVARVPAPDRASRRSRCSPPTRRPRSTTGATPSRARSSTSSGSARWPAPGAAPHAVLRLGRLDAALADPVRGDLRLDRRPGVRRPALAERPRARSTGSTSTATATATASSSTSGARRAACSTRAGRTRATRSATGTARGRRCPIALAEVQGYVFDAKRRMAGLAAVRGEDDARRAPPRPRPRCSAAASRTPFWVEDQRYYAMALDGEKRQLDAIGSNAGPVPVVRDRVAGARARRRRSADGPGDVLRLGHPDLRRGSARLQPDRLPHGLGLAARHLADRGRAEALRLRRGVQPARRPRVPGGPAVRGLPPARALLRVRSRRLARMPVPYPVACSPQAWAAGASFLFVETMLGLRAHAGRRELELRHPNLPDWLGKVTLTNLRVGRRVGRPALPSLARDDERGGPPQGRRPVRHDPALIDGAGDGRTGGDGHDRRARRGRDDRCRAAGSETRAARRRAAARRIAVGVDRTAIVAHPEAPVGAGRARARSRPRSPGARPASRWPTSAGSRSSTGSPSRSTRGR